MHLKLQKEGEEDIPNITRGAVAQHESLIIALSWTAVSSACTRGDNNLTTLPPNRSALDRPKQNLVHVASVKELPPENTFCSLFRQFR